MRVVAILVLALQCVAAFVAPAAMPARAACLRHPAPQPQARAARDASRHDQFTRELGRASRRACPSAQMSRICDITGKRANNANRVSFSNKHWAYLQYPNLQKKRFFSPELNRTVKLKVATSTIRTIRKLGIDATARKYGVDLSKF